MLVSVVLLMGAAGGVSMIANSSKISMLHDIISECVLTSLRQYPFISSAHQPSMQHFVAVTSNFPPQSILGIFAYTMHLKMQSVKHQVCSQSRHVVGPFLGLWR
jgi:hypothetical protein